MQDVNSIKVSKDPASKFKEYLEKTRSQSSSAPNEEEIGKIVKEVRTKRYAGK